MANPLDMAPDKLLNMAQSKLKLATVRTLNRLAASVNSKAASEIGRDLGIRNKDVKAALRVSKARNTDNDPEASVTATGKRIPLIAFAARQVRRGVSYRIGSQGRKTAPHLFIAKIRRSGHIGVFQRRDKARYPIDQRLGPSIPKSFVNRKVQAAFKSLIDSRMVKEMAANARFYAGKIGIGVD